MWWFDCLHLDGTDLIDRPLVERAEVLDRLAGATRVPAILTDDPDRAGAFLDAAMAAGPEVRRVIHLRTVQIGPEEVFVGAKLDIDAPSIPALARAIVSSISLATSASRSFEISGNLPASGVP